MSQEYRYAAVNRPPGYGAAPKGAIRIDPQPYGCSIARHGIVVYDRPLTREEYEGYELYPYKALAEVTADALTRLRQYGARYAEMVRRDGPDTIRSALSGRHGSADGFFTDIEGDELRAHITSALLAEFPEGVSAA